jgi:NADPH:quinone reductase-like Zn-dependent oxidoreductase
MPGDRFFLRRFQIRRTEVEVKAIVIHNYGGPEVLKYEDFPDPVPASGEVLVKVAASSINPFDWKIRSGSVKDFVPMTFPAILGLDVSGTVLTVGQGVTTFAPGDKVFAAAFQTYAPLCVVKAADLARVPAGADLVELAALPTVTTTGAQLAELAMKKGLGETVLVTGAAGNVGRSAVYRAKSRGATVIAGVLKRQVGQAKEIGADKIVALDDAPAVDSIKALDAVADTVSGPVADVLIAKIKPGGVSASVLAPPSNAAAYPSIEVKTMQVARDPKNLIVMAEAVKNGALTIPLGERFSLKDAAKAHAVAEKGSVGKILLVM